MVINTGFELLHANVGTNDLDVQVRCKCGKHIDFYVEEFPKKCDNCGRIYLCKVTVDIYVKDNK